MTRRQDAAKKSLDAEGIFIIRRGKSRRRGLCGPYDKFSMRSDKIYQPSFGLFLTFV